MSEFDATYQLLVSIDKLPADNSTLITAIIGALAVIVAGVISAVIAIRTTKFNVFHTRRDALDSRLKDNVVDILLKDNGNFDEASVRSAILKLQLVIDDRRSSAKPLLSLIEEYSVSNADEFEYWKSELATESRKYLTSD